MCSMPAVRRGDRAELQLRRLCGVIRRRDVRTLNTALFVVRETLCGDDAYLPLRGSGRWGRVGH